MSTGTKSRIGLSVNLSYCPWTARLMSSADSSGMSVAMTAVGVFAGGARGPRTPRTSPQGVIAVALRSILPAVPIRATSSRWVREGSIPGEGTGYGPVKTGSRIGLISIGIVLAVVGAILRFAMSSVHSSELDIHKVGDPLLLVGVIVVIVVLAMNRRRRGATRR
jgi:hypothetical protein